MSASMGYAVIAGASGLAIGLYIGAVIVCRIVERYIRENGLSDIDKEDSND